MIVDLFPRAKKRVAKIGTYAKGFNPNDDRLIPRFMGNKDKCQRYINEIDQNMLLLKSLREKYQDSVDGNIETELLNKMNDKNEENSQKLKEINKLLTSMKDEAKKYKYKAELKFEPEGRIMIGLSNAIQTKMYKVL